MFLLLCFSFLITHAFGAPGISEEIWATIFDGKIQDGGETFMAARLPLIGGFPSNSPYVQSGVCGDNLIQVQQQLGYDVSRNRFGPVFYDGDNKLCGVFNKAKQCSRYRVLKQTTMQYQEYDCVSFEAATTDSKYTAIQYLGVYAVIIENKYLGNYGSICGNGAEICSEADTPDGNSVSYKGNSGIAENTCFLVRSS